MRETKIVCLNVESFAAAATGKEVGEYTNAAMTGNIFTSY
jgi:hypothetical protein